MDLTYTARNTLLLHRTYHLVTGLDLEVNLLFIASERSLIWKVSDI